MTELALLEHAVAAAFIMVSWVLAHQNASSTAPFARVIAAGYGVSAVASMAALLFRHVPDLMACMPWAAIVSRVALTCTLGLIAARAAILSRPG